MQYEILIPYYWMRCLIERNNKRRQVYRVQNVRLDFEMTSCQLAICNAHWLVCRSSLFIAWIPTGYWKFWLMRPLFLFFEMSLITRLQEACDWSLECRRGTGHYDWCVAHPFCSIWSCFHSYEKSLIDCLSANANETNQMGMIALSNYSLYLYLGIRSTYTASTLLVEQLIY